jgi:lipid-binding SYLF domain-containing protein
VNEKSLVVDGYLKTTKGMLIFPKVLKPGFSLGAG